MLRRITAQSILEYCIFLGVVVSIFAAMQLYGKRGLQAALKTQADTMGMQTSNDVDFNQSRRDLFMLRAPEMSGGNEIRTASSQRVSDGKYQGTEVSAARTKFGGSSVSDVLEPAEQTSQKLPAQSIGYCCTFACDSCRVVTSASACDEDTERYYYGAPCG